VRNYQQTFPLDTRALPRGLHALILFSNAISCSVDLTCLPAELELVNLAYNQLTGPISLIRLPRTLQVLYIHRNGIRQRTVYYDLPQGIAKIQLVETAGAADIRRVRPLHRGRSVKDKDIFPMLKPENVS